MELHRKVVHSKSGIVRNPEAGNWFYGCGFSSKPVVKPNKMLRKKMAKERETLKLQEFLPQKESS